MLNRAAVLSAMKVVMMMLIVTGTRVEAAPAERDPLPSVTHASAVPQKPSASHPGQHLKRWLLSTKGTGLDGTTKHADRTMTRAVTDGVRAGRSRVEPGTADERAKMLKLISALEGLHRTFNSTLSSRITIMPRANGRNSGRKHKVLPAAEGGARPTTAAPAAVDSTASRASADVVVPSLTGRNFRKSLPPQVKKTNKRVCFWKYCSQN